jgi:hypothetical protein
MLSAVPWINPNDIVLQPGRVGKAGILPPNARCFSCQK